MTSIVCRVGDIVTLGFDHIGRMRFQVQRAPASPSRATASFIEPVRLPAGLCLMPPRDRDRAWRRNFGVVLGGRRPTDEQIVATFYAIQRRRQRRAARKAQRQARKITRRTAR